MQYAKVAPPGYERETEIVVARALTSVATEADPCTHPNLDTIQKSLGTLFSLRERLRDLSQISSV